MSDFDHLALDRTPFRRSEGPDTPGVHPVHALQTSIGNAAVARMLQRDAMREEAPEEEEELQAKHDPALAQRAPEVGLAGGAVSNSLAGRIESQRGGGSPLDDSTRTTMESALGSSLSGVRVHVGAESDALNQAITAKAFTTGNDVFVRSDHWAPGSSSTQRLMAHELTHVAQQQTMPGSGGGMSVGASDTAEEHEADAVADHVMARTVQRNGDETQQQE